MAEIDLSSTVSQNFRIRRRDTGSIVLNFFTDTANSIPKNVSTWEFFMTVKTNPDDPDASAVITIDPSDVTVTGTGNNVVTITIPASDNNIDARSYYYDIQAKKADATIQTIFQGFYIVVQDQTDRIIE